MTTTPINWAFAQMDNEQLLNTWDNVQLGEADYRAYRERIEHEITERMKADGATAIAHEHLTCELKAASPTYDQGKLHAIAELVPPEEWAKGFTPAHWSEPVWVEDKFNMVKIKPLVKYGDAVAQVFQDAAIPGPPRLVIKRKVEIA